MFSSANQHSTLKRKAIAKIFKKHRGAAAELARSLDPPIKPCTISLWFRGRVQSERLDEAIHRRAIELEKGIDEHRETG